MSNSVTQAELFAVKGVSPVERALDLAIAPIDDLTARYPWAAVTTNLGVVESLVTVAAR